MPPTHSTAPAGPLRKFTFRHGSIRLPNYLLLAPDWTLSDLASKTPADLLASLLTLNPHAAWQAFAPLCLAAIYGRLLGDHGTLKERVLLKLMFKHSIDLQAHHAFLVAWYPHGLVPDLENYCHAIQIPLEFALNAAPAKPLPRGLFESLLESIVPVASVPAPAEQETVTANDSETEGRSSNESPPSVIKSETPDATPIPAPSRSPPASDSSSELSSLRTRASKETERCALSPMPASSNTASPSALPASSSSSSTLAPSPPSAPPIAESAPQQQIIELSYSSSSSGPTTPEPMTRKRARGSLVKEEDGEGWVCVKREEGEGDGEVDGDGDVEMVVAKRSKRVGGGGAGCR
ncbi:MAG: hypothetical protein Q9184_005156 [Pyrenodesmia sp. 2 TL-2023]